MESEIEEKLKEIYYCKIKVKTIQNFLFEIEIELTENLRTIFLFYYNEHFTFEYNIQDLKEKINKEIIRLFYKGIWKVGKNKW